MISRASARLSILATSAAVLILFSTANAAADAYVQIGTYSTSAGSAAGVSSNISQPNYNYAYSDVWHVYWPAMTFPSQSGQFFFQAGYADPPSNNNCASFEWFVEAWFNSTILFANFGGCGTTGSHVFALANFGKDPSTGQYKWQWKMDSTIIGSPLMLNDATAPSNSAGVVSEITMPGSFIAYGMATVVYSPTVRIRLSDGTWKDLGNEYVYRANVGSYHTPCPPYNIQKNFYESVTTFQQSGSGNCLQYGDPLW